MHKSKTLPGWRKIGVVAGSFAILAAGAAGASQAFADPGTLPPSPSNGHEPATQKQDDRPKQGSRPQGQLGRTLDPVADRVTGRALTAAFYGAVTEIVPGKGSDFHGANGTDYFRAS